MALGGLVLGSLILYLKGMRIMMFQLSGFYYKYQHSPSKVYGSKTTYPRVLRAHILRPLGKKTAYYIRLLGYFDAQGYRGS